jgi:hypothetical protein
LLCSALLALTLAPGVLRGQFHYEVVALSREPAPGTSVEFDSFGSAAINAPGQLVFLATLRGAGVSAVNSRGLWLSGPPELRLLIREDDPAPGTASGVKFLTLGNATLNNRAQIVFPSTLTGLGITSANDSGVWSGPPDHLALSAQKNQAAPGTSGGVKFAGVGPPQLSPAGSLAFTANLTGSGVGDANDTGIWTDATGTLGLVAREDSVAPGGSSSAKFASFGLPQLNREGRLAFAATLRGIGVSAQNDSGLWAGPVTNLSLVAREGDPAPGTANGVKFGSLDSLVMNGAGNLAFQAGLTGSGIGTLNDAGLWTGPEGHLHLVVQKGAPATGTPVSVKFDGFSEVHLTDAGQVVFLARLTGAGVSATNDSGIWLSQGAGLALIVREGDLAPAAQANVTFGPFHGLVLPAGGGVAFAVDLAGNVTTENDSGIWATDPAGHLHRLAQEGDWVQLADGDPRRIADGGLTLITQRAPEDDPAAPIQVAFIARFIDGTSGLFLASWVSPTVQVQLADGNVRLTFPTVGDATYSVEATEDVVQGPWRVLQDNIAGTGEDVTVSDPVDSNQAARFYRVKTD